MAIGLTEEHGALAEAVRGWAQRHVTAEAVRGALGARGGTGTDSPAALPPFWDALAAQGFLALHVPEEHGGQGGGLVELCVALAELGARATPGPVLPTVLTSAVLLASDAAKAKQELLPGLADGSRRGAVFVGRAPGGEGVAPTAALSGTRGEAGLVVTGTAEPVLGAMASDLIVLPVATDAGEEWVAFDSADLVVTELPSLDPVRRVARVEARHVTVADDRILDGLAGADVLDLAAVLFGADAAGVASWCVTAAAEYAKVREQFGRPIGQFQGIKHKCARMLVALEQARAVVWDAARALDEAHAPAEAEARTEAEAGTGTEAEAGASASALEGARLAAAIAAVVALDAATGCAKECIQVHGGIGYTWEHDAHIYYRRALSLQALIGSSSAWAGQVARLAVGGASRPLDVDLPQEAQPLRERIRSQIAEIAALSRGEQTRRLAEDGLVVPHLPKPWGRGAGPLEQILIQQEMRAAGVRPPALVIGAWVVPSLASYGTPEQQQRFLPATLRGEIVWCQLFSEPGAGSDLASLQMRAERAEGGWKLTGQKIWTSLAQQAAWGICLARTDTTTKHEGITYFLVDMKSPGIDVRPLKEMTGEELFNEVFFDEVFVPDEMVVGEVNEGWKVARNTLANERVSLSSGATAGLTTKELLDLARAGDLDPMRLELVGRMVCEGQSLALLALRVTLSQLSGTEPGAAASVRKLVAMEHAQHISEACHAMLGAGGAIAGDLTSGPEGYWGRMILATRAMTIYGGTTEVQLNIIAERMLGLPRDP
jgi:alkylation response protein AidB-like acyl-CoA dehydrogenase